MITEAIFVALALKQDELPKPAELLTGEVVRIYERTMSRRGIFDHVLVFTPNKVFLKDGEARNWAMLSNEQKKELREIFTKEPAGLRSKQRPNPMWPSTYDGPDQWITYRVGKTLKTWTNKEYEYPQESRFGKFVEAIKTQLASH